MGSRLQKSEAHAALPSGLDLGPAEHQVPCTPLVRTSQGQPTSGERKREDHPTGLWPSIVHRTGDLVQNGGKWQSQDSNQI